MYNYLSKITILILVVLFLSNCDLVTTREAEEPEQSRSSYIIATTPDQLFTNLRNSFSEKVEVDYMSSFVDSSFLSLPYIFNPSSGAQYKYNILTEWDLDAEEIYFRNLINAVGDDQSITVTLELISNSISSQSESRTYNYIIRLPAIDEGISEIYEGIAFFKVDLDANNQWVITEWTDTQVGSNPTWSELKGRFYIF